MSLPGFLHRWIHFGRKPHCRLGGKQAKHHHSSTGNENCKRSHEYTQKKAFCKTKDYCRPTYISIYHFPLLGVGKVRFPLKLSRGYLWKTWLSKFSQFGWLTFLGKLISGNYKTSILGCLYFDRVRVRIQVHTIFSTRQIYIINHQSCGLACDGVIFPASSCWSFRR